MTAAGAATFVRRRLWFAWAAGAVMWAVWVGSLALGGWAKDVTGQLFASDHIAFYSAARLIADGRGGDIYTHDAILAEQRDITAWTWPGIMPYRNPPAYALLYVPTCRLPLWVSALVWELVGVACFVAALRLVGARRPVYVAALAATAYPVFAVVGFGQNTFLSALAFAAAYRLYAADRPFAAGLAAGVLALKPQLLLGPVVWWTLTARRSWPALVGVGVTAVSLAVVGWAAEPAATRAFVQSLAGNVGYSGEGGWNKHTPRAFVGLLVPAAPALAWWAGAACSLAAVGGTWHLARRTRGDPAALFPAAVFLSLWASPHALIYEWALLTLAAVVLWEKVPAGRDVWAVLFAVTWAVLGVSTSLAKFQLDRGWPVVVQVSVPVMGVVGWVAAREVVRRTPERGAEAP